MATETTVLTGLEPRTFRSHFEALTMILGASRDDVPVIERVRAWANQHGLDLRQGRWAAPRDPRAGDPGPRGRDDGGLQGHLDMVCERDPASPNDPAEGRMAVECRSERPIHGGRDASI